MTTPNDMFDDTLFQGTNPRIKNQSAPLPARPIGVGGSSVPTSERAEQTTGGYPANRNPYKGLKPGSMVLAPPYLPAPAGRSLRPSGATFSYGGVIVPVGNRESGGFVGYNAPNVGVYRNDKFGTGIVPIGQIRTMDGAEGPANTWGALDNLKKRYESDAGALQQLQKKLGRKGLLTKQAITGNWNDTTEKALATLMYVGNRNGMGWDQVLVNDGQGDGLDAGGGGALNGGGGGGGGGGSSPQPQPYSVTDTSVVHNQRKTVISTVKSVMQAELGRAPTVSEIDDFVSGLRGYERENPQVTTTNVDYVPDNNGGWVQQTDTQTKGGVDSSEMAAYLEEFGDDYRPKEERRYKRGLYVDQIMGMLGV